MTDFAKRFSERELSFGGKIFIMPFPSQDVVSIAGSIAGGVGAAANRSLAPAHAEMLLEGTKKRSKDDIKILLDRIGAELSFSASQERLQFFARVRPEHLDELLALIADVLREPSFPQKEFANLKKRALASLALEAEDTRTQAGILFARELYPKGHQNWKRTTDEIRADLMRITAADLRKFHAQTVDVSTLIATAVGDIAPEIFVKKLDAAFKNGLRSGYRTPARPKVETAKNGVHKPKVTHIVHKASIDYMAGTRLSITEDHPDYPALLLGLQVLGCVGGFTGRLMSIVREIEGLTYGTYAYLAGFDAGRDGHAVAWATFAPQLFEKGRAGVLREVTRIAKEGITDDEARRHGHLFGARFRVNLSNSGAIAAMAHSVLASGKPISYMDEFPERVGKLTAQEVNAAVQKYIQPAFLAEAAAGPLEKF